MILLLFILGLTSYSLQVTLTYRAQSLATWAAYLLACLFACIGACLWLTLARQSGASQTYRLAVLWDLMILGCYLIIPLYLKFLTLRPISLVGVALVLIGVVLINWPNS